MRMGPAPAGRKGANARPLTSYLRGEQDDNVGELGELQRYLG